MKHIYCISGLGADKRAFSKIDCHGYEVHYIKWLVPLKKESISDYAKRLMHQIHHPEPVLIGLSFGGIMCIEIARHIKTRAVILISSIKQDSELPMWMKLSGKLKVHKIIPLHSTKLIEPFENYKLGIETAEEKKMVHEFRMEVNQRFVNWAIDAVLNWKNHDIPPNTYQIHGKNDRIFPIRKVKADYVINGGHMMVMNRSKEVSDSINSILKKIA